MKNLILAMIFMFCVFTHVEAVPVTDNVVVLKCENTVDIKVAGSTLILSNLPNDFVPTIICFYGINVAGTPNVPAASFSIGWTGPDYDDLTTSSPTVVKLTGNSKVSSFSNLSVSNQGFAPVIPSGTNIYVNVSSPDTSTISNIQQLYIIGYYLF